MNTKTTDNINSSSSLAKALKTCMVMMLATSAIALPVRSSAAELETKIASTELLFNQTFDSRDISGNGQETDDFQQILGIMGLTMGIGAIAWQLRRAYKPSFANSFAKTSQHHVSLLARVNPKLRRELLRLVNNQQTANRLLSGTLSRHPNRSPNWLAEKVIYDLKRDRR